MASDFRGVRYSNHISRCHWAMTRVSARRKKLEEEPRTQNVTDQEHAMQCIVFEIVGPYVSVRGMGR